MGILRDIKDEFQKETAYGIIQYLIKDEEEAIAGYEKALEKLEYINMSYSDFKNAKEMIEHIIAEEKEHIQELQSLKIEEEI